MEKLTLEELNEEIEFLCRRKKAPEELQLLFDARNYMTGRTDVEPQDPRNVLSKIYGEKK